MLLYKASYIEFKLYIFLVHAFSGKQSHDLAGASAMLYCVNYKNFFSFKASIVLIFLQMPI